MRMKAVLSGRALTALVIVSFAAGTFFGYQLKKWHIEWLKKRKRTLERKLNDIKNELTEASGARRVL